MAFHRADEKKFLDDRGYAGHLIRGQAPYLLVEEGVRDRITSSLYWKEQCFALNAASLCDRAVQLTYVGGTYDSGRRPSPFLCLAFKMLQLDLEPEVVDLYLLQEDWKYLRALAAFYVRLTEAKSEAVYRRLEPFLRDRRKLRRRGNGGFTLTTMDGFVDDLLTKERVCATSLWKVVPRQQLEDEDKLEEYVSPVQHLLESEAEDDEEDDEEGSSNRTRPRSAGSGSGSASRSASPVDADGQRNGAVEERE